jgi:Flp pilus assembly pilin Flp
VGFVPFFFRKNAGWAISDLNGSGSMSCFCRRFVGSASQTLLNFWNDERGGPGVEYALLVSVVVVFIIAGVVTLGGAISDSITRAADILGGAME